MVRAGLFVIAFSMAGCVVTPGASLVSGGASRSDVPAPGPRASAPAPVGGADGLDVLSARSLSAQVEFDHGCPPGRVRLLRLGNRVDGVNGVDLDVCGVVRRYQRSHDGAWLDVTALFPSSSLPSLPSSSAPPK